MSNRDLIGEMLPVLCEKYMRSAGNDLAQNANVLFDALEALEREQKIRSYAQVGERIEDLVEEISKGALARNWKLVKTLADQYFQALAALPSLELVVLVAVRQEEILANVVNGGPGVEAFMEFADQVHGVLCLQIEHEVAEAKKMGRLVDGEDRAKQRTTMFRLETICIAAHNLFDNRLGYGRSEEHPNGHHLPCAPRELWARLGEAIYGKDDMRVVELRSVPDSGAGTPESTESAPASVD
jgi:hypothetical protein